MNSGAGTPSPTRPVLATTDVEDMKLSTHTMAKMVEHSKFSVPTGFAEVWPTESHEYFRLPTRSMEDDQIPVAVVIPCCNEEASELKLTFDSLKQQIVPPGFYLDLVVLADGIRMRAACTHP
eukprot:SAG11_NODE_6471_length_1306_cov_1.446562_2_plen_122_part_00